MREPNPTEARATVFEPRSSDVPGSPRPSVAPGPPLVDVEQTEHEVVVKIGLGWVVHDTIGVRCAERTLHVQAERYVMPASAVVQPSGWREGETLRFDVPLPCDVLTTRAHARLSRGVLTVSIPRAPVGTVPVHHS